MATRHHAHGVTASRTKGGVAGLRHLDPDEGSGSSDVKVWNGYLGEVGGMCWRCVKRPGRDFLDTGIGSVDRCLI